jgi:hypothetical protein
VTFEVTRLGLQRGGGVGTLLAREPGDAFLLESGVVIPDRRARAFVLLAEVLRQGLGVRDRSAAAQHRLQAMAGVPLDQRRDDLEAFARFLLLVVRNAGPGGDVDLRGRSEERGLRRIDGNQRVALGGVELEARVLHLRGSG